MHATYHVLARCNQRECIFRDDRDREEFLRRLETICGKNGWLIRFFVLMDNPYRLAAHDDMNVVGESASWHPWDYRGSLKRVGFVT